MENWLHDKWSALCHTLNLDGEAEWRKLRAAYTSNQLAYHNLSHISDCLQIFEEHKALARDSRSVEFALFYHDVIYDPKASDNEEKSAALASEFLSGTEIDSVVYSLIVATKHTAPPEEDDAKLICDIDLSTLGRDSDVYLRYARAIRQEYSWVSEKAYQAGRAAVLQQFLDRNSIYQLEQFQNLYEEQAILNLKDELERLKCSDV